MWYSVSLKFSIHLFLGEAELKRRSQALQRSLPRPHEVNNAILRPSNASDSSLSDLQKAEELIKKEMLTMMHYDAIRNPVSLSLEKGSGLSRRTVEMSNNFLANNVYQEFEEGEIEQVMNLVISTIRLLYIIFFLLLG